MSYSCYFCGQHQRPKTACVKVVLSKKMSRHPYRPKVGMHWEFNEKKGKWMWVTYDDPGGSGLQIGQEVKSCPDCALNYERAHRETESLAS